MNDKKSSVGRLNLRHVAVDTYHENVKVDTANA